MPTMMYSHYEMAEAVRLGWLTGVRDTLRAVCGGRLNEDEAMKLAAFAIDPRRLSDEVSSVLQLTRAIHGPIREEARDE